MRIVAIIQAYNEQRFIGGCLDHLAEQGVYAYLVDNESTDETIAIAERRLESNLIGIETLHRDGNYSQRRQLARKEQLAQSLDADWFIHLDADEMRVGTAQRRSLAQEIEDADRAGFNAINFLEFCFVPTREEPDHDHPNYAQTMRRYYPFLPQFPHRLNAWKQQDGPVELTHGGHRVSFSGLRMAPKSLYSRHYLILSAAHAARKFGRGHYPREEVDSGFHGWRARVNPKMIELPSERDLRLYVADHLLDPSHPRMEHIANEWAPPVTLLDRAARRGRQGVRRLRARGTP